MPKKLDALPRLCSNYLGKPDYFCARSSTGQSNGLLIRRFQVRISAGVILFHLGRRSSARLLDQFVGLLDQDLFHVVADPGGQAVERGEAAIPKNKTRFPYTVLSRDDEAGHETRALVKLLRSGFGVEVGP